MRTPNENNRLGRTRTQYCETNISMHQNGQNIWKDNLVKQANIGLTLIKHCPFKPANIHEAHQALSLKGHGQVCNSQSVSLQCCKLSSSCRCTSCLNGWQASLSNSLNSLSKLLHCSICLESCLPQLKTFLFSIKGRQWDAPYRVSNGCGSHCQIRSNFQDRQ